MTIEQLRTMVDSIYIKRIGHYIELRIKGDEVVIRVGYSYRDIIGLDNGMGEVWLESKFHSKATENHKNLFRNGMKA